MSEFTNAVINGDDENLGFNNQFIIGNSENVDLFANYLIFLGNNLVSNIDGIVDETSTVTDFELIQENQLADVYKGLTAEQFAVFISNWLN